MTHRKGHPQSRPLPAAIEPELPPHLRTLTLVALTGTLRAPIGSSMAQVYLGAARNLIDAAVAMERETRMGFERITLSSVDAAWLESQPCAPADFMKADGR